jgi:hypothetical protein
MSPSYISFQAVVFFAGFPPKSNAATQWAEVFEEPYRNLQTPAPQLTIASGIEGGYAYELHQHPERIDVVVRLVDEQPGPPATVSNLDDLAGRAIEKLTLIMAGMTVVRISAITMASVDAKSQEEVGRLMAEAVPGVPVVDGSTDQMFQLNKPTPSNVQNGLSFNRLCRWSSAVGMEVTLQMGPHGPIGASETSVVHWSMQTMIDINTVPHIRPEFGKIPELFDEIVREAKAVATEGFKHLV